MIEKKTAFHNTLLILNNEMLHLSSLLAKEKEREKMNKAANNKNKNLLLLNNNVNHFIPTIQNPNTNIIGHNNLKNNNNNNNLSKIPPLPNNRNNNNLKNNTIINSDPQDKTQGKVRSNIIAVPNVKENYSILNPENENDNKYNISGISNNKDKKNRQGSKFDSSNQFNQTNAPEEKSKLIC